LFRGLFIYYSFVCSSVADGVQVLLNPFKIADTLHLSQRTGLINQCQNDPSLLMNQWEGILNQCHLIFIFNVSGAALRKSKYFINLSSIFSYSCPKHLLCWLLSFIFFYLIMWSIQSNIKHWDVCILTKHHLWSQQLILVSLE
jgi:hypothetical protein